MIKVNEEDSFHIGRDRLFWIY